MKGYMQEFKRAKDRERYKKSVENKPDRVKEFESRRYFESNENDQQAIEVWKFITNFIDKKGIPPSMREIGKSVHLEQSSVRRRMQLLEDWGHIRLIPRIARGIVLLERPQDILNEAMA